MKARGGAAADAENYEIHDGDDDDDNLPFACAICREPFTDPGALRGLIRRSHLAANRRPLGPSRHQVHALLLPGVRAETPRGRLDQVCRLQGADDGHLQHGHRPGQEAARAGGSRR